ncbi:MAG: hypothetical protein M2R45_01910 [Verrucomicrobia subdivision 3 bacterium]|nr:hypothetical protein [Limisphaerales bacterium]MCS1416223.1 hypothetical protein [Limisphaerales bacterium]
MKGTRLFSGFDLGDNGLTASRPTLPLACALHNLSRFGLALGFDQGLTIVVLGR